jgi:hypothetical protein
MGVVLSRISKCIQTVAFLVMAGSAGVAGAAPLILSTDEASVIDGEQFLSGDLLSVDETPGSAALFLSDTIFVEPANVDAAAHQPDGSVILSTARPSQIGAESFENGDLVAYDPDSGLATLWLDDDVAFSTDIDIDAFHLLDDGHLLFSVRNDVTLFPGLAGEAFYMDGDVIEYDLESGDSFLYLSLFERSATNLDVNAVAIQLPEPGQSLLLAAALSIVGVLGRTRAARRSRA